MADGKKGEISQNYGTLNKKGEWEVLRLYDFKDFNNEIYHREAVLETDKNVRYQLNDILLPDGILRVDKVSVPDSTEITLGHYTLPEGSTEFKATLDPGKSFSNRQISLPAMKGEKHGRSVTCYTNGQYELAMIPLYGWTVQEKAIYPDGLHPVSHRCVLPRLSQKVGGSQILVTLQLWKKGANDTGFTARELQPVKSVQVSKDQKTVTITLQSGKKKVVTFE